MNFASKETIESASYPGVKFTVRRLNQIQRAKRDMGMVEHSSRFSKLLAEIKLHDPGVDENNNQNFRDDSIRILKPIDCTEPAIIPGNSVPL